MILKIFSWLITFLYCVRISHQADTYCYAKDDKRYKYFSYLTSYSTVRSTLETFNMPKGCAPIYALAFIRNGISYMSEKEIDSINILFEIRDKIIAKNPKNELCEEDLVNLENWNLKLDKNRAQELVASGKVEQRQLAQRLKEKLKPLLQSNSKDSYEFRVSSSKKNKDSAITFTNELLGTKFEDINDNGIIENELLAETSKNEASNLAEIESFLKSEQVQKVFKEISLRLGFRENETLSSDTILSMYKACGYENAWGENLSPAFCAAFLQDHLKILEYLFDLKDYYIYGYGNKQIKNLGMPEMKIIVHKLSDVFDKKSTIKATFHFSSKLEISALLVALGVYRDQQPLTIGNYETMKDSRQWRSSSIDSFSSNVLAVIYSCSNNEDKKVGLYHNENLLKVPFCAEQFCTLTKLKEEYKVISGTSFEKGNKEINTKTDVDKNEENNNEKAKSDVEKKSKSDAETSESDSEKEKETNLKLEHAKKETNSGSIASLFGLGIFISIFISLSLQ